MGDGILTWDIPLIPDGTEKMWPGDPKFDLPPSPKYRRVTIRRNRETVDQVIRLIHKMLIDRGWPPARLLLGWRTHWELSLEMAIMKRRDEARPLVEWDGIELVMDPSRENYAQAIEHWRWTGQGKRYVWEPKGNGS